MNDWLHGKTAVIIGERDGVPGPSIAKCLEAAGAEVAFAVTECFVWTAAGAMDLENQRRVKEIAESSGNGTIREDVIVVLGASDLEGALISAETVTLGDPSYSGPLAGVSLRLPVYHILEPKMKEAVPEEVYEETVGMSAMMADTEKIGEEFEALRQKVSSEP